MTGLAVTGEDSAYVSGERVFGPPVGTFDIEWVAREVERGAGCTRHDAHRGVRAAWVAARATASLDEALLADAVGAEGLPGDTVRVVVGQVVAYCRAYEVDPAAR